MDPQSRIKVREYIKSLARKKTVILTTHNMDEADRVADRVAIIDHGELLVLDTPEALKRSVGEGDVLEIGLNGQASDEAKVQAALAGLSNGDSAHIAPRLNIAHGVVTVRALNAVSMLPAILEALTGARPAAGRDAGAPEHSRRRVYSTDRAEAARMNVLAVARKSVLEIAREPVLLALAISVPVFFMVIYTLATNMPLLSTHPVLVMNPDPPALAPQVQARGQPLVEALTAERYADGRPAFKITLTADRDAAEAALKDKTATALVSILPDETGQLRVTLRGDPTSMAFIEASALLDTVANRYLKHAAGIAENVRLVAAPLTSVTPQTYSDLYTPGLIVIAVLLNASLVAMLIAREIRWGTLQRLRLTRLRPWELFAGLSVVQMALSGLEVALMFLCAMALGFHNHGSPALVLGIGLILSFSAIGLGLIVACFVSDDSQAINVGGTAAMVLVFLSGAMFPLPPFTVFTFAGHEVGLFDFVPASHVVLALQQVMCYGAGWREIGFQIAMAAGLSALYFALGVIVFGRRQMRQGG